jgi:uncharacterized iron-regulated membrane protein
LSGRVEKWLNILRIEARMRATLLFIHRWLGLTAGIVFAIASLSGAVLVYEPELERLLSGGPRFATTPGTITPREIETRLAVDHPGLRLEQLRWPIGNTVYVVELDEGGRNRRIFLDPGTGNTIRARAPHIIITGFRRLHTSLLVGPIGNRLVIYTSVIALLSLALGVILWWPGIRKFFGGFRIRTRRGFYLFNFDTHNVMGVLAFPLLFVMTATGVFMRYHGAVDRIDRALGGRAPDAPPILHSTVPAARSDATALSLERVVGVAVESAGGGDVTFIDFGENPTDVIEVRVRHSIGGDSTAVALDRYTGNVLGSWPLVERGRFTEDMNSRLHMGRYPSQVLRLLWALSCVIGGLLLPTGAVMWWMKRRRLVDSAERRTERARSASADEVSEIG